MDTFWVRTFFFTYIFHCVEHVDISSKRNKTICKETQFVHDAYISYYIMFKNKRKKESMYIPERQVRTVRKCLTLFSSFSKYAYENAFWRSLSWWNRLAISIMQWDKRLNKHLKDNWFLASTSGKTVFSILTLLKLWADKSTSYYHQAKPRTWRDLTVFNQKAASIWRVDWNFLIFLFDHVDVIYHGWFDFNCMNPRREHWMIRRGWIPAILDTDNTLNIRTL